MRIHSPTLAVAALLLTFPLLAEKKAIVPPEFAAVPGAPALPFSPGILVDGTDRDHGDCEKVFPRTILADLTASMRVCTCAVEAL